MNTVQFLMFQLQNNCDFKVMYSLNHGVSWRRQGVTLFQGRFYHNSVELFLTPGNSVVKRELFPDFLRLQILVGL